MAVSYTHLDVYKRQHHILFVKIFCKEKLSKNLGQRKKTKLHQNRENTHLNANKQKGFRQNKLEIKPYNCTYHLERLYKLYSKL